MTNVPTFMMNIPSSYDTAVRNNVWMEEYDDEDIIENKFNLSKIVYIMI